MADRRLLLIRHAQAAGGPVDAERPLTGHGAEQASAIGTWLARSGLVPDRVVVSPARRAQQTWARAAAELTAGPPPVLDGRIYDNTVEGLLAVVQETPDDVATLAVVGHNPSIGALAAALDETRAEEVVGFPAGGVAVFGPAVPFTALAPGTAALTRFTVPRG